MTSKMRELVVDGITIKTNFAPVGSYLSYPVESGNFPKKYSWSEARGDEFEIIKNLIHQGYRTIRFVHTTTYVPGCYKLNALYC